jgi:hypothetical protein
MTQINCSKSGHTEESNNDEKIGMRTSITFIMNEDKNGSNTFYKNATYYYNMHPSEKSDIVQHSCRTLEEVIEYLNHGEKAIKYKVINIVCHGNAWQGLAVPINGKYGRASLPNLTNAYKKNNIPALCSHQIDQQTKINIVSCGIGQNNDLVEIIGKILSCPAKKNKPIINLESDYVNFTDKLEMRLSSFYFVTSKYDYEDPKNIASKLRKKYDSTPIEWERAYETFHTSERNIPYKHCFRMMVEWNFFFDKKNMMPVLTSDTAIRQWLETQPEPSNELAQMQLTKEDFMWHCFSHSDEKNGIKIKGYSMVAGVMIDQCPFN